jgi:3-hydroxypropanoate dehydrogenase
MTMTQMQDLFLNGRTHSAWLDKPVDDALLKRLYELTRMGPTGGNSSPLRLVFVRTAAGKERLRPALFPGNVDKTMNAPVTAIVAHDTRFYEHFPQLFPARPETREKLASMPEAVRNTMGLQSATLQAGYLIIAARALGLDCGPMGGFDTPKTDALFFPDGRFKSSLLINLGYGDPARLFPRQPRLEFDEACTFA